MNIAKHFPELDKALEAAGVQENVRLKNQIILALGIARSQGEEIGEQKGLERAILALQDEFQKKE